MNVSSHLRCMDSISCVICCVAEKQVSSVKKVEFSLLCLSHVSPGRRLNMHILHGKFGKGIAAIYHHSQSGQSLIRHNTGKEKVIQKSGKKEHHLWQKRDSAGSGQKALNLVQTICRLPHEKDAVYGALDKWIAWETEFPLIAAAKALRILRKRNQWKRLIQVAKWMLSKGQGATLATYDSLLLAFDMEGRTDEAEMLWNMILHAHNRSISKRLFSRMISLYDHKDMPDKVMEVFADMEELGVWPDQDTVRRIARAFEALGQDDKRKLFVAKYQSKWKYVHFKGERIRVKLD